MATVLELTWARGAVDPSLGIFHDLNPDGDGTFAWSTEPLPDFVLAAGSYVTLQRYSNVGGAVDLDNIAVAYTVGAGPVASVSALGDILPLLQPATS